jgi:biotin carboxylase
VHLFERDCSLQRRHQKDRGGTGPRAQREKTRTARVPRLSRRHTRWATRRGHCRVPVRRTGVLLR